MSGMEGLRVSLSKLRRHAAHFSVKTHEVRLEEQVRISGPWKIQKQDCDSRGYCLTSLTLLTECSISGQRMVASSTGGRGC